MTPTTLRLTRRDVATLLSLDECIAAVERAFLLHSEGRALGPGVLGVPVPGGVMNRISLIALLALAVACRAATGPGGRSDPTALVTNNAQDSVVVTFTWSTGRPQAATLQAGGFACVAYTVLADSGRFIITIPTPSGVNAGHGADTLGPSAWFKIDSTASAYSFRGASLAGPDLALLIMESSGGAYGYAIGSAQACAS